MNKIVRRAVRRSQLASEWFAANKNKPVTIVTIETSQEKIKKD